MRAIILTAVCLLLLSATAANAEFYRWVDKDGKENFTNDPNNIPPEYRDQSAPVEVKSDRVSVGEKPVTTGTAASVAREHRDKHGRGEEWWRLKARNLRLKLRDLQDEYDLVLKKEREQEEKQTIGKKKKSKTNYEHKKMKLEKEIARARRALEADLPEEARKAGAYPGWIRE